MVGAVAWVFLLEQVTRVPTAGRPWGHVAMVLTGVLAYAMSYSETARQHARPVAVALGVMLSLICIVSVLYYLPVHPRRRSSPPGDAHPGDARDGRHLSLISYNSFSAC